MASHAAQDDDREIFMTVVTKTMIAAHVADHFGFSKNFADDLVSSIFNEIIDIIIEDGKINIPNFGSFEIRSKQERPGVNMQSGARVTVSARNVIRFVPSKSIKERLNE